MYLERALTLASRSEQLIKKQMERERTSGVVVDKKKKTFQVLGQELLGDSKLTLAKVLYLYPVFQ